MPPTEKAIASGITAKIHTFQTIIIGSGAAGLACAERLYELGVSDIAVLTDKLGGGASANSGSDKQTYYKLGIFGDVPDSPMDFARTLTAGGMMHGDLAYIEGVSSPQAFFNLVRNGVPFPFNRYGAYVGYKTDHDPRQRATSAGPKTSQLMVQTSLAQVRRNHTTVFDGHEVIRLLTRGQGDAKRVVGALAIDKAAAEDDHLGLVLFSVENIVMATGGPGDMYAISVYPVGQIGNHGLAFEIGAIGNNLTESQFGLASTKFRWNLSGTYQQVLPTYFSTDAEGNDRRHFLNDYFHSMAELATNTFLKGYQWPFHAARLQGHGSSIVDIAVHNEIAAGRRVFLDFMRNPPGGHGLDQFSLSALAPEALTYLESSGATQATPYKRLQHMNPLSIEIYEEHHVDLHEPLEVAVCSQHNNGGLRGNIWWESNVKHLFPIGELNGAHGVRPGGSALNSGQVGAMRAAQYIARAYTGSPLGSDAFLAAVKPQIDEEIAEIRRYLNASDSAPNVHDVRTEIQQRVSAHAAFIRSEEGATQALNEAKLLWGKLATQGMRLANRKQLSVAIQNTNLCLTHIAYLETLKALITRGGGSRGAYMVLDGNGDLAVNTKKGECLCHRGENVAMREEILETRLNNNGSFDALPVPVRPLPEDDSWYETTWSEWRDGTIFRS